jgi:peptidoglycan/xylan/chitin deacetylase (PgdA/CDA1 family)
MRNYLIQLCLALLLWIPINSHAQSLALSFDDGLDPRDQLQAPSWNAAILTALSNAEIKSILFAAGKRVDSPEGLKLVKEWGKAGHAVGNHTYSHLNFSSSQTTLEAFTADVEKNEALLKGVAGWTQRFRFPYLKEGETAAKRDEFRRWLAAHQYKTGAVSIDASDWYYNNRYLAWKDAHPGEDPSRFRAAYLEHLWCRAIYYDALSEKLFQRSIKHVLLLHTNAINAAFLPDVIAMFQSKRWTFISPEEAYQDEVYSMNQTVLPAGESILWSLAKQNDFDNLRFPAEDDVYEKPLLDKLNL